MSHFKAGLLNGSIIDSKKGRAKPSTEAIAKIAQYFGVSTDCIIFGKDSEQSLTVNEKEVRQLEGKAISFMP